MVLRQAARWVAHGQRGGLGGAHLGLRCRSRRSGRSSEPGCEARTHPRDGQGRALSSARPLGTRDSSRCAERAEDENRITCARARSREQPNARANDSSSREDHGDMRRRLGRARIDARLTWLFELSWRSRCVTPISYSVMLSATKGILMKSPGTP